MKASTVITRNNTTVHNCTQPRAEALSKESHFFGGLLGSSPEASASAALYRTFFPTIITRCASVHSQCAYCIDHQHTCTHAPCRVRCSCTHLHANLHANSTRLHRTTQLVGGGRAWRTPLAVLRRLPHLRMPAARARARCCGHAARQSVVHGAWDSCCLHAH